MKSQEVNNSTVSTLPKSINESQTIPIKLKQKLSYKHHYQFQNVRPRKALKAAKYLGITMVKLELRIRTEQHLSIAIQYVNGNSEVRIGE